MKRLPQNNDLSKKTLELLAPAGSPEAGYAALHYGADAVYLGLENFSARSSARNFSLAELADITGYAHSLQKPRKIYAAINTLVLQHELSALVDLLAEISAVGVDAVIVQDFGLLNILCEYFPKLKVHASTQMAIHNRYGVETAVAMGLQRVTLARELTISEVAEIVATKEIETEVFVHGALCYSYSGLCLFSSHLYGRSGNRGRCAYPCREWFEPGGFIFSMKDLALGEYVAELRRAGVTALKIEGRMKSPLYVAAAVNYYRKLIDGSLGRAEAQQLADELKTIFSRPWTDLYFRNRKNRNVIDREIVGHRGCPAGRVEEIVKYPMAGRGASLRNPAEPEWRRRVKCDAVHCLHFKTEVPIELHDGLQIDVKGLQKPFGFSVKNIFIREDRRDGKSTRVFAAPAGSCVEIPLPGGHPHIALDSVIYSSSSQKVKRDYDFFRPKAGQFRLRQTADFEVRIDAAGFEVGAATDVQQRRPEVDVHLQRDSGGPRTPPARNTACSAVGRRAVKSRGADFSDSLAIPAHAEVKKRFESALQPARDGNQVAETIETTFRKLGNTGLQFGRLKIDNPSNYFIPVSLLNAARRDITASLEQKIAEIPRQYAEKVYQSLSLARPQGIINKLGDLGALARESLNFKWSIKTDQPHALAEFQPSDWNDVDEVIFECYPGNLPAVAEGLERLFDRIGKCRLRLSLPVIMREWEIFPLTKAVAGLIAKGWRKWQISNLWGWSFLNSICKDVKIVAGGDDPGPASSQPATKHESHFDISADWPLYALNNLATSELQSLGIAKITLSPEDGLENMSFLLKEHASDATVIVYQDTPLMISESCIFCSGKCADSDVCNFRKSLFALPDGNKIRIERRGCRLFVLNDRPYCLVDYLDSLSKAGAVSLRVDFMYRNYLPAEAVRLWRSLRQGEQIKSTHCANFMRELA